MDYVVVLCEFLCLRKYGKKMMKINNERMDEKRIYERVTQ